MDLGGPSYSRLVKAQNQLKVDGPDHTHAFFFFGLKAILQDVDFAKLMLILEIL